VIHLGVWNATTLLGRLSRVRGGVKFAYDHTVLERVGLGRPIVSMSMPTSARPYPDRSARPFFDGLLPEGEARRIIAYDFNIAESDTFGLLRMIGRDCAGALTILPEDERPLAPRRAVDLAPLERASIDRLIANLRYHPLGVDATVRASLGGVQEKLLPTSRGYGSWALPAPNVASTHILKPTITGLDDTVMNEAICLRFAALAGVRAAAVALDRFGGRDVLVVQRFDRRRRPTGQVTRVHQENACQALAVPVAATALKYEADGGPSLRTVAALLTRWSTADQLDELLRQTTVNVLVGNADAHAVNTSSPSPTMAR
jgi:serine/threonine-protein kinase HipA